MSEGRSQERDTQHPLADDARQEINQSYRQYLDHIQSCVTCSESGVNCDEGNALKDAHRAAKDRALLGVTS
jgi:hypothetical protein